MNQPRVQHETARDGIRSIYEFRSNYGADSDPFDYPGDIPVYNYVLDGELARELVAIDKDQPLGEVTFLDGQETLDEFLQRNQVESMAERIPVVAYGANQNPRALYEKFGPSELPETTIVPSLNATLHGYAPVAHEKPGIRGNVFAELAKIVNIAVSVKVVFLTKEQLLLLTKSEPSYSAGVLSDAQLYLPNGQQVPTIVYAGDASIYLEKGKPVVFSGGSEAGSNGLTQSATSEQMTALMVNDDDVAQAIRAEAPEYAALCEKNQNPARAYAELMTLYEPLKKRAKVQRAVRTVLEDQGKIGKASLAKRVVPLSRSLVDTWPTMKDIMNGWSENNANHGDPNDTHFVGRLAVQVLNRGRGNVLIEDTLKAPASHHRKNR